MKQAALAGFAAVIAAVGMIATGSLSAQQPQQGKGLQFEVAAIKPGDPGSLQSGSSGGAGRFRFTNAPLKEWVEQALLVSDYALKAPAWLDTARFDLNAKLPADVPMDHNPIPDMLRALLVERFGLKWHEEASNVSGYELVPDKKVLVQPATVMERLGRGGSGSGPAMMNGTNMTMQRFSEMLGTLLGRPVVDATHLSGGYDIKVTFRPVSDAGFDRAKGFGMKDKDIENLPSIFDGLREQLGLRLQPAKVPSKIIVVDNINRQPTDS